MIKIGSVEKVKSGGSGTARFEDWDLWSPTLPETILWWYRGIQHSIVSSPLCLCSLGSLGGSGQRWVRRADTAAQPTHQLLHVVG